MSAQVETDDRDDDLANSWIIFIPNCTRDQRFICEVTRHLNEARLRKFVAFADQLLDEQGDEVRALIAQIEHHMEESRKDGVKALSKPRKRRRPASDGRASA